MRPTPPDQTERLRAGQRRELQLGPIAPWHTTIEVWVVPTSHGRQTTIARDYVFEVTADWYGPPAVGFPPSREPVSARDTYVIYSSLDDARALAHAAAEAFGKGGDWAPDLRELATGKPATEQSREPRLWTPNS